MSKYNANLSENLGSLFLDTPLTDYETVVNSITATKTETGLKVYAVFDKRKYKLRKQVSDTEMAALNLRKHKFHGEWNYTIKSRF